MWTKYRKANTHTHIHTHVHTHIPPLTHTPIHTYPYLKILESEQKQIQSGEILFFERRNASEGLNAYLLYRVSPRQLSSSHDSACEELKQKNFSFTVFRLQEIEFKTAWEARNWGENPSKEGATDGECTNLLINFLPSVGSSWVVQRRGWILCNLMSTCNLQSPGRLSKLSRSFDCHQPQKKNRDCHFNATKLKCLGKYLMLCIEILEVTCYRNKDYITQLKRSGLTNVKSSLYKFKVISQFIKCLIQENLILLKEQ